MPTKEQMQRAYDAADEAYHADPSLRTAVESAVDAALESLKKDGWWLCPPLQETKIERPGVWHKTVEDWDRLMSRVDL